MLCVSGYWRCHETCVWNTHCRPRRRSCAGSVPTLRKRIQIFNEDRWWYFSGTCQRCPWVPRTTRVCHRYILVHITWSAILAVNETRLTDTRSFSFTIWPSAWLAQLVNSLVAPAHVHLRMPSNARRLRFDPRLRLWTGLTLASFLPRIGKREATSKVRSVQLKIVNVNY